MTRVKPKSSTLILLSILLVAGFLRFWQLGHADVVTDEAFYGIRSLGYLDFLGTQAQGTPAEWYDVQPWWAYLSFHDHPPLTFVLQHFSLRMFGENAWGLRMPSAIAGIAVIYLLYVLGRKLKSNAAGLCAAALGATELYLVWPSRLGLQESVTLAMLLWAVYLFLCALERPRLWYAVWTVYGLALMSKYTVVFFLPLAISYLLLFERRAFYAKPFWIGQGLQGLVTLPLTIYNVALYLDRKHFDLQLSTLLGIDVPAWRHLPGKEIGTMAERLANFAPTLWQTASPVLIAAAALAIFILLFVWRQKPAAFVLLGIIWTALLLLVIGPSPRFLVLLAPWLLLAVAVAGTEIFPRLPGWGRPALVAGLFLLVGYDGYYTWVNTFSDSYLSGNRWSFSILRRDSGSFGYQQLDDILRQQVDGFKPRQAASVQYPVLQKAIDRGYARDRDKTMKPLVIAYDADLAWPTPLWYFLRRTLYHGWTAISTDGLKTALEEGQFAALVPQATGTQVLLVVGNTLLERTTEKRTESAEWFAQQLGLASSTPTAVIGTAADPQFTLWTIPATRFPQLIAPPPK
ncbi:MAG: hypothetical protein G01um101431_734 [Parcubacteria group bacterium Gr01-1014_31]|nr:MAG: hypothetical protein G01um101431_734 [Parcubacteria group bacterium Gr01-1014_31]